MAWEGGLDVGNPRLGSSVYFLSLTKKEKEFIIFFVYLRIRKRKLSSWCSKKYKKMQKVKVMHTHYWFMAAVLFSVADLSVCLPLRECQPLFWDAGPPHSRLPRPDAY